MSAIATKFRSGLMIPRKKRFEVRDCLVVGPYAVNSRFRDWKNLMGVLRTIGVPLYRLMNGEYPSYAWINTGARVLRDRKEPFGSDQFDIGDGDAVLLNGTSFVVESDKPSSFAMKAMGRVLDKSPIIIPPIRAGSQRLKHPVGRWELTKECVLIGRTIVISQHSRLRDEQLRVLEDVGFEIVRVDEREYDLHFPIFELNGELIAIIPSSLSQTTRDVLDRYEVEVFEVELNGEIYWEYGCGIRGFVNSLPNVEILDFFGLEYSAIRN